MDKSNYSKPLDEFLDTDFKAFSQLLLSIPPLEFGLLSGIIGTLISSVLSSSELNSLGNFLEAIGQVMLAIQAQEQLIAPHYPLRSEFEEYKKNAKKMYDDIIKRNIK